MRIRSSRPFRRLAAPLLGLALAAGVSLVSGGAARATVADIDAGGTLTQAMVVERALSWADEKVPYSQTSWWPAGAPTTGAGHGYRQDCSGFVSMAWDLPVSAVTADLVSATSPYDVQLPSWASLQPGDLLGVPGHVVLFLGWSADDAGRHRYADLVSESTTGHPAAVALDQDDLGYWKLYVPYRYRHVVADAPVAVSSNPGRVDQVRVDAAGHLQHRWQSGAGTPWGTEDMTARYGGPVVRGSVAIASSAPGTLAVFGVTATGSVVTWQWHAGWTVHPLTTGGVVSGLTATSAPGRVDLFGRSHAVDGAGSLVHAVLSGSALTPWVTAGGVALADDAAVARISTTEIDAVVEGTAGTLWLGVWRGAAWAWTQPFGATRVTTRPALSPLADGTLVLTVDGGGILQQDTRPAATTTWRGFAAVPGVPALGGTPGWASSDAAAMTTPTAGAPLDVWAVASSGVVVHARRTSAGAWSYLGTA